MAGPSFQLVMHSGPNQGKVAPLEKSEIYIGRDLSNDIVINDAEISRRHARLMLQASGFVIEDLGSTNGTSVNGQRLMGPYILRPGDVLTLGEHVNLGFEPVTFDADATIAAVPVRPSSGQAPLSAHLEESPTTARSSFSGRVPTSPEPVEEDEEEEKAPAPEKKRSPAVLIAIIAAVLLLVICICGAILWFIDANYLWCTVFPFIPNCP